MASTIIKTTINTNSHASMKVTLHSLDTDLIRCCLQKDRLAQKYLYQRYFGKMLGIPMRYTNSREEAIEVLNTAFMRVFDSLGNYKEEGSFSGWIARIVYRTAIDHARSNSTYKKIMNFNGEEESSSQSVENEALGNLAAEELYVLIQQLPTATRSVFSMYVIEGYKHHEIAQQLDISTGTSKWHLSNARKILQTLVQQNHQ